MTGLDRTPQTPGSATNTHRITFNDLHSSVRTYLSLPSILHSIQTSNCHSGEKMPAANILKKIIFSSNAWDTGLCCIFELLFDIFVILTYNTVLSREAIVFSYRKLYSLVNQIQPIIYVKYCWCWKRAGIVQRTITALVFLYRSN